jgi:hypothetical protein
MNDEMARLQQELELLSEQLENLREQTKIVAAMHMFDRFHAFDAIKDDSCPCCGARVKVHDNGFGSGLKLEAVHKEAPDNVRG